MPIIAVEVVGDEPPANDLAQRLADDIGACLEMPLRETWVRVRHVPTASYAEAGGREPDVEPVLVSIIIGQRPTGDRLVEVARDLTAIIADCTGRPAEHVHLVFEPDGIGRVAFGGELA